MDRLARSSDPRDRLRALLLGELETTGRITLGHAIRTARKSGLGDEDALADVERLARPKTAYLHRFGVDRYGSKTRIVSRDEVLERAGKAPERRQE
jgi:hypothetical protein